MSLDYLGNPIDTLNPATRQGLDDFVGGFLGYQPRAEGILAVADATPTQHWPTDLPACC